MTGGRSKSFEFLVGLAEGRLGCTPRDKLAYLLADRMNELQNILVSRPGGPSY